MVSPPLQLAPTRYWQGTVETPPLPVSTVVPPSSPASSLDTIVVPPSWTMPPASMGSPQVDADGGPPMLTYVQPASSEPEPEASAALVASVVASAAPSP